MYYLWFLHKILLQCYALAAVCFINYRSKLDVIFHTNLCFKQYVFSSIYLYKSSITNLKVPKKVLFFQNYVKLKITKATFSLGVLKLFPISLPLPLSFCAHWSYAKFLTNMITFLLYVLKRVKRRFLNRKALNLECLGMFWMNFNEFIQ